MTIHRFTPRVANLDARVTDGRARFREKMRTMAIQEPDSPPSIIDRITEFWAEVDHREFWVLLIIGGVLALFVVGLIAVTL